MNPWGMRASNCGSTNPSAFSFCFFCPTTDIRVNLSKECLVDWRSSSRRLCEMVSADYVFALPLLYCTFDLNILVFQLKICEDVWHFSWPPLCWFFLNFFYFRDLSFCCESTVSRNMDDIYDQPGGTGHYHFLHCVFLCHIFCHLSSIFVFTIHNYLSESYRSYVKCILAPCLRSTL